MNKKTVRAICVVISYLVIFGLLIPLANATSIASNPIIAVILLLIFAFFTFKTTKGILTQYLSFLPWPFFYSILIAVSMVFGVFITPYYVGKWIAGKIVDE